MYRKLYTSPPLIDVQNSTSNPIYFTFGTEQQPPALQTLTHLGAKPPRVRLYPHYSLSAQDLGADTHERIYMILSNNPHPASAHDASIYSFAPGKLVYIQISRDKNGALHVSPQRKPKRRARKIVDGRGKRVHVRNNVTSGDIEHLSDGATLNRIIYK